MNVKAGDVDRDMWQIEQSLVLLAATDSLTWSLPDQVLILGYRCTHTTTPGLDELPETKIHTSPWTSLEYPVESPST